MARFRKKHRSARTFGRRVRHSRGGNTSPLKVILPALAYGAGRQYLSNIAQPLTSKIPLGNYADEILFGVGGYFLAKKGRGMLKNVGMAMLTVEAASIGHQVVGGLNGGSNGGAW
jgi:hypothetical protein